MARKAAPIREGFHTVTPHLTVKRAADYISFLEQAFGAREVSRMPAPDGRVMHAELRIGDSVLMLNDDFPEYQGGTTLAEGRLPLTLHMYVNNADEVFARATAAGCQVVMALENQFWGDRYGQVRDPFGFTWAIATHLEELTPQEIQERQAAMFGRRSAP